MEHERISAAALSGTKLVAWGARLPDQPYVTVGSDNRAGGRLATAHLLARGRRHIAFVGDCRLPEIAQRHDGYLDALRAAGLPADGALVVPTLFEAKDALAAMGRLMERPILIDGVVAASDVIAIAAIQALAAAGFRVPTDVSVIGFDDIVMAAHTSPPLTTIRQDIARGAEALADRMLALIEGGAAECLEMSPILIVRGST